MREPSPSAPTDRARRASRRRRGHCRTRPPWVRSRCRGHAQCNARAGLARGIAERSRQQSAPNPEPMSLASEARHGGVIAALQSHGPQGREFAEPIEHAEAASACTPPGKSPSPHAFCCGLRAELSMTVTGRPRWAQVYRSSRHLPCSRRPPVRRHRRRLAPADSRCVHSSTQARPAAGGLRPPPPRRTPALRPVRSRTAAASRSSTCRRPGRSSPPNI